MLQFDWLPAKDKFALRTAVRMIFSQDDADKAKNKWSKPWPIQMLSTMQLRITSTSSRNLDLNLLLVLCKRMEKYFEVVVQWDHVVFQLFYDIRGAIFPWAAGFKDVKAGVVFISFISIGFHQVPQIPPWGHWNTQWIHALRLSQRCWGHAVKKDWCFFANMVWIVPPCLGKSGNEGL